MNQETFNIKEHNLRTYLHELGFPLVEKINREFLNLKNKEELTPLYYIIYNINASKKLPVELLEYCIRNSDLSYIDKNGMTPLMHILIKNKTSALNISQETLTHLILNSDLSHTVHSKSTHPYEGWVPLVFIASFNKSNNINISKELLYYVLLKTDLTQIINNGKTVLSYVEDNNEVQELGVSKDLITLFKSKQIIENCIPSRLSKIMEIKSVEGKILGLENELHKLKPYLSNLRNNLEGIDFTYDKLSAQQINLLFEFQTNIQQFISNKRYDKIEKNKPEYELNLPQNLAQQAINFLVEGQPPEKTNTFQEELKRNYVNGIHPKEVFFGCQFALSCVEQIIKHIKNNSDPLSSIPKFSKYLGQSLLLLNDSGFGFGLECFKQKLISSIPEITYENRNTCKKELNKDVVFQIGTAIGNLEGLTYKKKAILIEVITGCANYYTPPIAPNQINKSRFS